MENRTLLIIILENKENGIFRVKLFFTPIVFMLINLPYFGKLFFFYFKSFIRSKIKIQFVLSHTNNEELLLF